MKTANHPARLRALELLVGAVWAAACGEPQVDRPSDAHTVAPTDGSFDLETQDIAASDDVPGPAVWQPPSLAPPDEGTSVTLGSWVVAALGAGDASLRQALDSGSFVLPPANTKAYGAVWAEKVPDAGGQIQASGSPDSVAYAATSVTLAKPMGLVVRADRAFDVWAQGRRQPGDVYGSGALRVPLWLPAGTHPLVFRTRGGNKLGVGIETSSHEVRFNGLDTTWPHLRLGDAGERWLGIPILVLAGAAGQVTARVEANAHFESTQVRYAGLAGGAVTQLGFRLQPKSAPTVVDEKWPVVVRVDSPDWTYSYEHTLELSVVAADAPFRQTFRSPDDHSVQFYGVRPPLAFDGQKTYALVLSLHGAGVDAFGQAQSYSSRDWTWLVAATNRRPFGFDWEEWGRINAIATLDDAQARFSTDPTRTYLTGHSMGGHGTWHVGVHHAGRFALIGPSAGWNSFYTYGGAATEPKGPFGAARAHSKTTDFMGNLSNRAVFVIHGDADTVVPWSEGKAMLAQAEKVTTDTQHYWHPGGGHWWDGDQAPGIDCVDWSDLFETMKARTLDPTELTFSFTASAPWYGGRYSFVTIAASLDPLALCQVEAQAAGPKQVELVTSNVRTLLIDGQALTQKGVETITVDGIELPVAPEEMVVGPTAGKRLGVSGPYNQVFHRPFLFVYDDGAPSWSQYAAYLVSYWALIGNGHAGALPRSRLTPQIMAEHNLIWLGIDRDELPMAMDLALSWNDERVDINGFAIESAAAMTVFDAGDRLSAALWAPAGQESLAYGLVPFSSRAGMPDYVVWGDDGLKAAGFFDAQWQFDPQLGVGW